MYNEDSFSQHLFWVKIKRIFLLAIFSIIGCVLGIIISSYLVDVLLFSPTFRILIITTLTLLFFALTLIATSSAGQEIQEGYWKIAVLRKLTLISKKLDYLEKLDNLEVLNNLILENNNYMQNSNLNFNNNMNTNNSIQNNSSLNFSEQATPISEEIEPKKTRKRTSTKSKTVSE